MKFKLHRKWRSASNFDSGPLPQSREPPNDGPIFSTEDGLLTVNLHNRAVALVCPEDQRERYDPLEEVGPPSERLRLEWVHGYRGRDGRANLHLLPTGEMVYPMATIVVLLHCSERSQRHFTGHTEEVEFTIFPLNPRFNPPLHTGALPGGSSESTDVGFRPGLILLQKGRLRPHLRLELGQPRHTPRAQHPCPHQGSVRSLILQN